MADVVDAATRSRMMSGIRGRDTKPERQVRAALHRLGFRYRLQPKRLPGKPDIVLTRWQTVIFVHGCFWHGHECKLFRLPATRREFWSAKIARNRDRDREVSHQTLASGWRSLTIWECALRAQGPEAVTKVAEKAAKWIKGPLTCGEIRGGHSGTH
jgi:DNA mismatch endonuclease, patch repair protein